MRYTRIGLASYAIGGALVATVIGVAWHRSRAAPSHPEDGASSTSAELGARVYAADCAGCHGDGTARGRSLPSLQGGAVALFTSPGGREYLIDLMLTGQVRSVRDGQTTYRASHPRYPDLSDDEVAAVLDHLLRSWGNEALLPANAARYTPEDVTARRAATGAPSPR